MTGLDANRWNQVFGFSVLDHVPVGCCVLNSRMEVVFWNKVLERWTHIDRWDILHRKVGEFFPQLEEPHYRIRFWSVFRGGPPLIFSHHLHGQIFPSTCADGRGRLQHTTVTSIPTHDGAGGLACLAVEDVSQVTRRMVELRETRDQAEKLAREARRAYEVKSQFLANMSHELRTPLNSILLLSRLLLESEEGRFDEAAVGNLTTILQSGQALLELVDDILDLSKVEAGKHQVTLEPVDLQAQIQGLVRATGPLVTHKGLDFRLELDPDLPEKVMTDPQALQQILRNLLSNSSKFAEEGEVVLRAELCRPPWLGEGEDGAGWLAISVQDHGPGIARDKQEAIFEPFTQEDQTISRNYGGTGLGLTISRQLAVMLGGRLELQSEPGLGATFTLYLPLDRSAVAAPGRTGSPQRREFADESATLPLDEPGEGAAAEGERWESDKLTGLRILLADDNMRDLFTLSGVLEGLGAQVVTARSYSATREALQKGTGMDLVVMNIQSCVQEDQETMQEIQKVVRASRIPMVCTSRQTDERVRAFCGKCAVSKKVAKADLLTDPVATLEAILLLKV
jgi:signal transduction histidine kinase